MKAHDALLWPAERAADAAAALADALGCTERGPGTLGAAPARSIEAAAGARGLEAHRVEALAAERRAALAGVGPALVRQGHGALLAVLKATGGRLFVVAPDGSRRWARLDEAAARLFAEEEAPHVPAIEALLDRARVTGKRRHRARRALLDARLAGGALEVGTALRLPASAGALAQSREAALPAAIARLVAGDLLQVALHVAFWAVLGRSILAGRTDAGLLAAAALLLATIVVTRLFASDAAATLSARGGAFLQRRLLAGTLAMDPDVVRAQGTGALFGRAIEAAALQTSGSAGALALLLGLLEAAAALFVFTRVPGGGLLALGLAVIVGAGLALAVRAHRRRRLYVEQRLHRTSVAVEKMIGHRTRLCQEPAELRHDDDDRGLAALVGAGRAFDGAAIPLALLPRAWMLVGATALAPMLLLDLAQRPASPALVAAALGAVLLAFTALGHLANAASELSQALCAWGVVRDLIVAGGHVRPTALPPAEPSAAGPLLEARGLHFRHRPDARPVLEDAAITLTRGDRVLLQGSSGGGKSTLAAILSGARAPQAGLLLVGGLDRHVLGEAGLRRQVARAPQFHDNHVLAAPFSFNLLMGRAWPPSEEDLQEAAEVCHDLGLDALVERMPGGMMQMVGDTGWRLSHGEKSRLFMARALLQKARVVILDESLAALDPLTMRRCLAAARKHAAALVVIQHP
jgi:ATP-binding cassette, subfamily B, bacterial